MILLPHPERQRYPIAAFVLCLVATSASAQTLPAHHPWPGGVAVLNFGTDAEPPLVELDSRRVFVLKDRRNWVGIVGIPLNASPGRLGLTVNGKKMHFSVRDREYGESRITITDKAYADPPDEELLKRIVREREVIREARRSWRQASPDMRFLLPAEGQASTPFGFKRYINGQLRSSHRGLDIAAPEGTAVVAPSPGLVVLAGDFFYTGLTIILDHGMGVKTLYSHLSALEVGEGDSVEAGQLIGAIGATGRVTGPHLHWSLYLNDTAVDPLIMLNREARAAIGLTEALP